MNKKKLRIAMFGQKCVPSRLGGVEVVVGELSTRMAALGHEVTCYNRSGHEKCGKLPNVRLKTVPTIPGKGLAAVSSSFFAAVAAAFSGADVCHIHGEGPAFMSFLPKLLGKPVIVTVHGLDWQREKWRGSAASRYILLGEKMAVRFADEIIVLSRHVQDYFLRRYGRKTHYIPNGVTEPVIRKADQIREAFGLHEDDYILFVGRLVPEKGIACLIDAFQRVKTDKKLVIAGASSDTDSFAQALRDRAKQDGRILFTGFVQGQLLEELFSNAYLYVLPSDLEGMPLSLLEAMSYGNCCVVSDIPECAEVVEDHAFLFPKGDPRTLGDLLQKLCDDPPLTARCREKTRNFVYGKYQWDEITGKTMELYYEDSDHQ